MSSGEASVARPKQRVLVILAGVTLLIALLSIPKFDNEFVWDDVPMFVDAGTIWDLGEAPTWFSTNTMYVVDGGRFAKEADLDTYRPFTLLTMALDGAWGGQRPLPLHITNLVLHLIGMWLVFAFLLRLFGQESAYSCAAAAALWGLQPMFTEAHVWINGRSDLLAAVLGLGALLLWLPKSKGEGGLSPRAWLAAPLLLLALLSKETIAMVLPAVVLWQAGLLSGAATGERIKGAALRAIPLLVACGIYAVMRLNALSGAKVADSSQIARGLLRVPLYLFDGIAHCIAPYETSLRFMNEEYSGLPDLLFLACWAVLMGLFVILWRKRRQMPDVLMGALWFAVALAPATLISLMKWYGFGRYLYIPSIGLAVCLVSIVRSLPSRPRTGRMALGAVAIIGVLYAGLFLRAQNDWQDEQAFYRGIMRDHPDNSHGPGGLGEYLVAQRNYAEAIPLLERALQISPSDSRHWNNLAQAYLRSGNLASANVVAVEGWKRFNHPKFPHVVAVTLVNDSPAACVSAMLGALKLNPEYKPTRALLAELLQQHPRRDEFAAELERQLGPENEAILRSLR